MQHVLFWKLNKCDLSQFLYRHHTCIYTKPKLNKLLKISCWVTNLNLFSFQDFRLAKTLCIVIAVFVVTWTPFFIVVLVSNYPEYFVWDLTVGQLTYFAYFVKFSQYASSACNPFIYAFRQRQFKHALYDICGINSSTNRNLVREGSQTSTRITRTLVHRLSKSSDRNEQVSLYRLNNGPGGEQVTNGNGQHCQTHALISK